MNTAIEVGFATAALAPALPPNRPLSNAPEVGVICFRQAQQLSLWVVFDLMDLDAATIHAIRQKIEKSTPDAVLHILSTHNHGVGDAFDTESLGNIAAATATEAMRNAHPALFQHGYTEIVKPQLNYLRRIHLPGTDGITTIWFGPEDSGAGVDATPFLAGQLAALRNGTLNYAAAPQAGTSLVPTVLPSGDRRLDVLAFYTVTGRLAGILIRFAAHAVTANLPDYYTGDYPAVLRRILSEKLHCPVLFFNGPCGEIAPAIRSKSPHNAEKIAAFLAENAVQILQQMPPPEVLTLYHDRLVERSLPVRSELLRPPPVTSETSLPSALPTRKRALESAKFAALYPFLRSKLKPDSKTISVRLGLLRLNQVLLLALPGESFSATAVALAVPEGFSLITVTEHERTAMYLPPPEEIRLGGYEAICRIGAVEAEPILRQAAQDLLNQTASLE
ncbi:MAG: hypothetical protein GX902_09050 [Lentisphaerae bacterium]|nr:hypothetical protein [Lentisphaerota bacterium]